MIIKKHFLMVIIMESKIPFNFYKYEVEIKDNFEIELPKDAKILTVQTQAEIPHIWAMVLADPNQPTEKRFFKVIGTGHQIPNENLTYIGTFQLFGGGFVGHLFERER